MASPDNPAGRLYEIQDRACSFAQPNRPIKEVWAQVLGGYPADNGSLYYPLSQLIQLTQNAKKSVQQLTDVDQTLYLKPFENIERAFATTNLDQPWSEFKDRVDDATMIALRFVSDALSRMGTEDVIDPEVLSDLQSDVGSLLEKVLQSDLPDELKTVLIESLEDIRGAILEYRIRGADGLRRVLESSVGAVLRQREQTQRIHEEKELKVIFDFLGILRELDKLVAVSLKAKELVAPVVNYFLPSGSSS